MIVSRNLLCWVVGPLFGLSRVEKGGRSLEGVDLLVRFSIYLAWGLVDLWMSDTLHSVLSTYVVSSFLFYRAMSDY